MKTLLSNSLWSELLAYRREARVRFLGAISYVTVDPLELGEGDVLVCDASPDAIQQGATSAHTLAGMVRRDAAVYTLPALHAKVCVIGSRAFVGSANMSARAAIGSIEAGLWTDDSEIYAATRSFIDAVQRNATRLTQQSLKELQALPVKQLHRQLPYTDSNIATIGHISGRTWWVSTEDLTEDIVAAERDVEKGGMQQALRRRFRTEYDVESIRWTGRSAFMREAKRGDRIVDAHWPDGEGRGEALIYTPSTIVHREDHIGFTYFYVEFRSDRRPVPWKQLRPHLVGLRMDRWSPDTSREVSGRLSSLVSIIEKHAQ